MASVRECHCHSQRIVRIIDPQELQIPGVFEVAPGKAASMLRDGKGCTGTARTALLDKQAGYKFRGDAGDLIDSQRPVLMRRGRLSSAGRLNCLTWQKQFTQ